MQEAQNTKVVQEATLRNGKVIHFQEFMNSAALNAAFGAGAAV